MKYEGADRCRNIEIFIMYRTVKWVTRQGRPFDGSIGIFCYYTTKAAGFVAPSSTYIYSL